MKLIRMSWTAIRVTRVMPHLNALIFSSLDLQCTVVRDIRGRWKLITCWVLMLEMDVLGWKNEFFA